MYQTILFDLDGTLTDPGLGITNSVMHALKKWGIEVTDRTSLYRFIGPPLQDSFMQYYGFSKEDAEKSVAYYREYFREKGLYENEVYPGAEKMLADLKAAGKTLAVATSKPEEFAIKILKHFHLDGYFDVIAGATMDSSRSKKADVIAYCLETLGVTDRSQVVMVGDREHDIIGAKTVGVDSIGVLVGYGSREELETAGATCVAETLGDVAALILGKMDYQDYFHQLFPGFFERDSIRAMAQDAVAEELIIDLHTYRAEDYPLSCPGHITFGWFKGDVKQLLEAVREVEEGWAEYYEQPDRAYCAFDGEKVVSFCLVDHFGEYKGLKVGGPGCVGTIPSCRRQGIGLKMVQNATVILQQEGYDISHIHYTGVGPWYMHMGYKPVLKWNSKGFVDQLMTVIKGDTMEKHETRALVTKELIEYIHTNVFPVYAQNDRAHQLEHIEYVIRRSLLFMQQFDGLNADMVYAIAAYHDIAHHVDKDNHEILSASMFENDLSMKRFFSDEKRRIMKEAIEDHRASLEYEPRSNYGKIVSSADRSVDVDAFLRRTHAYSLKHFPEYTEEQNMERCYQHMKDKYGSGGYAKHYVVDKEYLQFQQTIRNLIEDRNAFEEKYRAVNRAK